MTLGTSTFATPMPVAKIAVPPHNATIEPWDRKPIPATASARHPARVLSMPNTCPRRANGEKLAKISKGSVASSPTAAPESPRLDRIASSTGPTLVSAGRRFATRKNKQRTL
jgi:hypothetical protein